ncbi:MAG: hypothetical protein DRP12_00055 [Candidatus Aenigmatarchaeota archaeon]|nr:MAG: hypothetical protein DRP12_00055 [Candidatus Aenigmarchaeota archaeon]
MKYRVEKLEDIYQLLKPDPDGGWFRQGRKYTWKGLLNRAETAGMQGDELERGFGLTDEEWEAVLERYERFK